MKIKLRLTAVLLVMTLLFAVVAVGCDKDTGAKSANVSFNEEITLSPLNASSPKHYLMYNPDRGFRTDLVINVNDYVYYANDPDRLISKLASPFRIYFKDEKEPCSLAFAYIYLTEWHLEPLSEDAIKVIKGIFEYCRMKKYKLLLNFCYNGSYGIPYYGSEENKKKLASECADQETILTHIDQLAPVVAEYRDCIYDFECGFIGFVGEWVYSYQYPHVNFDIITMAIVEKLCVPNGLYFSHRSPSYKASVEENYPDWPYLDYISYNNCAMYGEQTNPNWHSGCYQVGHNGNAAATGCRVAAHKANSWWEYVSENGAYTPQGGEMFTSGAMNRNNTIPEGKDMILEVAHHWHSTMSFWHGKYDCPKDLIKVMETWEEQEVTKEWLDENNILYDPNWFIDKDGNVVKRNCYEFIRDHLGYKLVAEKAKVSTENGKVNVDMSFKNYGMAAAFNLISGFAILNEKYEVVSEVAAGTPSTWYSHDPENYRSNVALEHSISASLDAPTAAGKYYVAFYLKNTMGVGAKLSNKLDFENECNILYSFEAK